MYKWRFFMTKTEVIDKIAREKVVEKIARHYKTFAREDLCQYVYLYLLEKVDENKLIDLYQTGKLKQYLAGIVHRQALSNHSEYARTYKQVGLSIENEDDMEHTWADKLVYMDDNQHQLEDDFEAYYNQLEEKDKDMLWLLLQPLAERREDIDIWCNKNGMSYKMYLRHSSNLKNKIRTDFGLKPKFRNYPERQKRYHKKVEIYDKATDKLITVVDNVDMACEFVLQHTYITKDMIYKVLCGNRLSAKGYKFNYVD